MTTLKHLFRPIYAPLVRRWRRREALRRERKRIRSEVRRALQAGESVRIVIGAGQTSYTGWIATDIPALDVSSPQHWAQIFPPNSINRMLAEHVFEHLPRAQFGDFLAAAREYLAPDGRIRIAVPDGYHPDSDYIELVRPDGTGEGAEDHKALYTCHLIGELLDEHGYHYELIEYFDDSGHFHQQSWSADDGVVLRSAAHDQRNRDGQLRYTSLIVDCWP